MIEIKSMKKKIIICLALILLALPVLHASADVTGGILSKTLESVGQAGGYETTQSEQPTFIAGVIATLINYILGLLGVVFVLLTIYGGWLYMTAGGNDEQVKKGKEYLINAVVGLIIILGAYTITWFVTRSIIKATQTTEQTQVQSEL